MNFSLQKYFQAVIFLSKVWIDLLMFRSLTNKIRVLSESGWFWRGGMFWRSPVPHFQIWRLPTGERQNMISSIARIANAVPCRSLLKDDNEGWDCCSQVLDMQRVSQCSQVFTSVVFAFVFVFVFVFVRSCLLVLINLIKYLKKSKVSHSQSALY